MVKNKIGGDACDICGKEAWKEIFITEADYNVNKESDYLICKKCLKDIKDFIKKHRLVMKNALQK